MPDLDELERLLAEATPGPWDAKEWHSTDADIDGFSLRARGYILPMCSYTGTIKEAAANASLIAALRNAAAELIADARRWRELNIGDVVHDAVLRALDEAGVRNEVLRGMCLEVAIEKAQDALAQERK